MMPTRLRIALGVAVAATAVSGCASGFDEFMNDLNRPYTAAELAARDARRAGEAKQCTWYTPDEAIVYYGDCSRSPWDQQ